MITHIGKKLYFEKLEEYINFIKKNFPIIFPLLSNKNLKYIILNGEKYEIHFHGIGINLVNENINIDFDFTVDNTRIYYDKWKFHNFLENLYQKDSQLSNVYSREKNNRLLEYNKNHDYFYNKNWISEKKGLKGGFYISK